MITDIQFDLDAFRSDYGYVLTTTTPNIAYISATRRWSRLIETHGEGFFENQLVAFLSHESMHSVITKVESDPASTGMDNLVFPEGDLWELARF